MSQLTQTQNKNLRDETLDGFVPPGFISEEGKALIEYQRKVPDHKHWVDNIQRPRDTD